MKAFLQLFLLVPHFAFSQVSPEADCGITKSGAGVRTFYFSDLNSPINVGLMLKAPGDTMTVLNIEVVDSYGVMEPKGFKLMLDNGDIIKDEDGKISVNRKDDGYHYTITAVYSKNTIARFAVNQVSLFELDSFRRELTLPEAKRLKEQASCLFRMAYADRLKP